MSEESLFEYYTRKGGRIPVRCLNVLKDGITPYETWISEEAYLDNPEAFEIIDLRSIYSSK